MTYDMCHKIEQPQIGLASQDTDVCGVLPQQSWLLQLLHYWCGKGCAASLDLVTFAPGLVTVAHLA